MPVTPHDVDPEDLAEELPPQGAVRVFRVPVDRLVDLARAEILRGLMHDVRQNPHPVPEELLPLLELCKLLGAEAFDLVLVPKAFCPLRLRGTRARALALCRRWYVMRFQLRLRNCPLTFIFPHLEGWQE